jgi:hypothetical protein
MRDQGIACGRELLSVALHGREAHNCVLEDGMPNWMWIGLLIVGYLVLTQWLLPKMGVPT